jgi:hypothetical protein
MRGVCGVVSDGCCMPGSCSCGQAACYLKCCALFRSWGAAHSSSAVCERVESSLSRCHAFCQSAAFVCALHLVVTIRAGGVQVACGRVYTVCSGLNLRFNNMIPLLIVGTVTVGVRELVTLESTCGSTCGSSPAAAAGGTASVTQHR